jgi:hypothetical protein
MNEELFKRKGEKIAALFFVLLLVALSADLSSKERRGADLRILKKDGSQTQGELIAVRQDSLLLLDSSKATDVSIDIPDIKTIKILKKSKTLLGVGLGLVIGGAAGTLAGYEGSSLFWQVDKRHAWAWTGGVLGLVSGAISR